MDEEVVVCFRYDPDGTVLSAKLPKSFSVAEIRSLWSDKSGREAEFLNFALDDDTLLPEEGTVADILLPNRFSVEIRVSPELEIALSLRAMPATSLTLAVRFTTTADIVIDRAKAHWNVRKDRKAKLFNQDRLVDPETLMKDLESPEQMEVDVVIEVTSLIVRPTEYQPAIWLSAEQAYLDETTELPPTFPKDADDLIQVTSCFLSTPASHLMDSERPLDEQRLISGDFQRTAGADTTLSAILTEEEIAEGRSTLLVELAMDIFYQRSAHDAGTEVCVWPTDQMHRLRRRANQRVFINNEEVTNFDRTFREVGCAHGSFAKIVDTVRLHVRDTSGQIYTLTVDKDMGFDDFRLMTRQMDNGDFLISVDGTTILRSTKTLRELNVHHGSKIDLYFEDRIVRLKYKHRETSVVIETNSTFSALLHAASKAFSVELPQDTKFACTCGRTIEAKPRRTTIPRQCCPGEELLVSVNVPVMQEIETSDNFEPIRFRLPDTDFVKAFDIFRDIRFWGLASTRRHRVITEEHLYRSLFDYLEAKDLQIRQRQKVRFSVRITKRRRIRQTATPDTKLLDVAKAMERRTKRKVVDFSTRNFRHRFNLQERKDVTLWDAPVRNGQILTVEPFFSDHATQTVERRFSDTRERTLRYFTSKAATLHLGVAYFRIWWRENPGKDEGQDLDIGMPLNALVLRARQLRMEVSDRLGVSPSSFELVQRRGKRAKDNVPVAQIQGGKTWIFATAAGETTRKEETKSLEAVKLQDDDPLFISGAHLPRIYANKL